ncbi:AAA family ATPase [Marinimicrobium sp. ABcell2]|uniref:AAA family ATPase n=1 Tax=Marinimicrobium sp. ABcell2 TaxID=3069751 RepID=UPI0027AFF6C3|nr:AAA family ATPase [Marinimicrobium sp. ABcell2]MDQ2076176.1 AAA family ATPase [Marinimicrobium sp. ABcell2]
MLVEFCGIQGAGKTTLSRELKEQIPGATLSRGRSDRNFLIRFRLLHRILDGLKVPHLFFRCLPKARSKEELELICRLCCYEWHKKTLDDEKVNILEESTYHALARLAGINSGYLKLAAQIAPPDIFVWVTCREDIALDRILNRHYEIDINHMEKNESLHALSTRNMIISRIVSRHGKNVYKIDNTDSGKEEVAYIAKSIVNKVNSAFRN